MKYVSEQIFNLKIEIQWIAENNLLFGLNF